MIGAMHSGIIFGQNEAAYLLKTTLRMESLKILPVKETYTFLNRAIMYIAYSIAYVNGYFILRLVKCNRK